MKRGIYGNSADFLFEPRAAGQHSLATQERENLKALSSQFLFKEHLKVLKVVG